MGALVAPQNVVLVGASDRPGSWAARVWRNLNRYGFEGRLFPMNPGRADIGGEVCYPDFASLPEKPDHLVILAPAAPMTRAKALDMIARTRAHKLIEGFRGGAALDAEPVIIALMALGALAQDVGDCIESIEINPFRVLPAGGCALNALIILRRL